MGKFDGLVARLERLDPDVVMPRLHPNGFYTFDLSAEEKVHVWPDRPPRRRVDGGFIHDHTFSFLSMVLVGRLLDTRFDTRPMRDGYALWHVPCRGARTHRFTPSPSKDQVAYHVSPFERKEIRAGDGYDMAAGIFHRSDPIGFTATWMNVVDTDEAARARILLPPGRTLDPFDRTLAERELAPAWFALGKVLTTLR